MSARQLLLVRANTVYGASNSIACLLNWVLATVGIALVTTSIVHVLFILEAFALASRALPCQRLLLQRVLVRGLRPLTFCFLLVLLLLDFLRITVACMQSQSG